MKTRLLLGALLFLFWQWGGAQSSSQNSLFGAFQPGFYAGSSGRAFTGIYLEAGSPFAFVLSPVCRNGGGGLEGRIAFFRTGAGLWGG